MTIYQPEMARLVQVETMTDWEKLFTFELPPGRSLRHRPGQFVMVSVLGIGEAAISITSSPTRSRGGRFDLCVRRVGNVTKALHRMEPGSYIGVRGPYGRGYPIDMMRRQDVLIVAGGLGLAPLRPLIQEILDERDRFGRLIILVGARDPSALLFRKELGEWVARDDVECKVTVDHADGSWLGRVGLVTSLFSELELNPMRTIGVICGPPVMYRYVVREMEAKGIPETRIYVSLERHMKCGVGKCGHCQIEHLYCCQEGPVFPYAEIKDVEEAL